MTTDPKPKPKHQSPAPPEDDIHRFHDLIDTIDRPINTNDYKLPQKPAEPTYSVVEMYKPYLLPPHPEEANTQKALETIQTEPDKDSQVQKCRFEGDIKCCIDKNNSKQESEV